MNLTLTHILYIFPWGFVVVDVIVDTLRRRGLIQKHTHTHTEVHTKQYNHPNSDKQQSSAVNGAVVVVALSSSSSSWSISRVLAASNLIPIPVANRNIFSTYSLFVRVVGQTRITAMPIFHDPYGNLNTHISFRTASQIPPVITMHHHHHHHQHDDADAADEAHAKLARAEQQLAVQTRKCENLIAYYTRQLRQLADELRTERAGRTANDMEHMVRALMRIESKLRTEQTAIRQQLYTKDVQLNRLQREIVVLRERHVDRCRTDADAAAEELHIDRVAQFCPSCRKEFYLYETKSIGVQVQATSDDGQLMKNGGNTGRNCHGEMVPTKSPTTTTTGTVFYLSTQRKTQTQTQTLTVTLR